MGSNVVAMLINFVVVECSTHWKSPSLFSLDSPSSPHVLSTSPNVYKVLGIVFSSMAFEFKGHMPVTLNLDIMFFFTNVWSNALSTHATKVILSGLELLLLTMVAFLSFL